MTNLFRKPSVVVLKDEFEVDYNNTFTFDAHCYRNQKQDRILDLTDCELNFIASDDRTNPTLTITKSIGAGIFVLDAAAGHARVTLDPADTTVLGQYGGILYFDLVLIDPDAQPFTVAKGTLKLKPDAA